MAGARARIVTSPRLPSTRTRSPVPSWRVPVRVWAAVEAITALFCYTRGAALYELARTRERADLTSDRQKRLEELVPDEYPTIHDLIPHLAAQTGPEQFRSGLRYLIQGMAMERTG